MIIRDAQVKAMEAAAEGNYIGELMAHCREFAPGPVSAMTEEELRLAVTKGVDAAEKDGFDLRGPVRFYIDLMLAFGSGFATDPQYPWAAEILAKHEEMGQMERAEELNKKTQGVFAAIFGEKNEFSLRALEVMLERVKAGMSFKREGFKQDMLQSLKEIYPQKFAAVGEDALKKMITNAIARGRDRYGFKAPRSMALAVTLMYAFGHRFDVDPFLPWISRTLKPKQDVPPDELAADLEKRAAAWFEAALKNAKEGG